MEIYDRSGTLNWCWHQQISGNNERCYQVWGWNCKGETLLAYLINLSFSFVIVMKATIYIFSFEISSVMCDGCYSHFLGRVNLLVFEIFSGFFALFHCSLCNPFLRYTSSFNLLYVTVMNFEQRFGSNQRKNMAEKYARSGLGLCFT